MTAPVQPPRRSPPAPRPPEAPPAPARPAAAPATLSGNPAWRFLMLLGALLSLALGILGIFVPGLPTTVFILMAAWFAARGSPRLLAWLEDHRLFGPMIRNWRNGGTVSRRAKWSATAMMAVCAIILFAVSDRAWAAAAGTGVMAAVAAWLWRRPEPPATAPTSTCQPPPSDSSPRR